MKTHSRYRVMTAYQAKYENPIRFESGELITLGGRDAEFPEFLWATDENGREGWVHQSKFLGTSEKKAVTTAPYNAIELTSRTGELVTAEEMLGDWSWCSNAEGVQGWLPNHVLEKVTEVLPLSIRPIEAKDDAIIADNESSKGDHRHYAEVESIYKFTTPEQLITDFQTDIARWNNENSDS